MRGERTGRILWCVSDQVVHIAIDVCFVDEQIQGRVSDGMQPPRPFSGWLGLIAALDGLLGSQRQDGAVASAFPRGDSRSPDTTNAERRRHPQERRRGDLDGNRTA